MIYKVVNISILLLALSCTSNVDNPKHVHFVFFENFEGNVTFFESKNCGQGGDTIYIGHNVGITNAIISPIHFLNGVQYRHYWKYHSGRLIEIPEYPKSNQGFSITSTISGSFNDFSMIRLRLSNISTDTLFLKNGRDDYLIEKKYENFLFEYVDSLEKTNCLTRW